MEEQPRPLELGDVVAESFRVVGENFGLFAALAAIVLLPNAVAGLAIELALGRFLEETMLSAQTPEAILQQMSWMVPAYLAVFVVTLALYSFGQAAAMHATVEHLVGRKASLGDSLRVGLSRLVSTFFASMLMWVVLLVGFLLCFFPGLVAMVWLAVALPAIVVERLGPIAGLARSIELTEGHRWTIFLVYLVVGLAFLGFSMCIVGPATLVATQGTAPGELPDPLAPGQLVVDAINLVVQGASFMVFTALVGVIYARLRGLRDGVDASALAQVFS